ncbi:TolC family protein [Acidovorax sp. GBBC 1281]|uniref:TolC family protein n=1 Tax=Acidovorax sp. SUPP2522 TaxID=511900 RepID=UPI00234ACBC0|nr:MULTISPECIES: TolC family protein [unclassified Acidovorax]WCN00391.1 TolC family protein [Acidovorax sp. GBBC 1281]
MEAAWQRAAQAREAEGQTQRAAAERLAISSPWAAPPALELSYRDDRWQTSAGRREAEVGLAWPLWLPGQRTARGAAVNADVDLSQAAVQAGRLHFAGLVREAAWGIAAQKAEADLADAQVRSLQDISEDVRRRVKAGDLAHADGLAAQSEALAAQSAQLTARQRLNASAMQWTTLTGLALVPDLAQANASPDAAAGSSDSREFSVETHPDARVAALAVERARKRLDVVTATRRDPPELLLRIRQETPGRGESAQNSIGVGLRIPLGTASRNQPLQAAALSELDVALTTKQRTDERLAADAAMAQAAVHTAEQQWEADRQRSVLLRERAALIDRSFKAGETPLPELLRAFAAATQAEASFARQQAALGLARARLQQSLGILP